MNIFVFKVKVLNLINNLPQFLCYLFLRIGNAIQFLNFSRVVLIYPLLVLANEVHLDGFVDFSGPDEEIVE